MNRLLETLRQRQVDHLVADARLIRDWPDPAEQLDAACRQIRRAMFLHALGRGDRTRSRINIYTSITDAELDDVLGILNFAWLPISASAVDRWETDSTLP